MPHRIIAVRAMPKQQGPLSSHPKILGNSPLSCPLAISGEANPKPVNVDPGWCVLEAQALERPTS